MASSTAPVQATRLRQIALVAKDLKETERVLVRGAPLGVLISS
jgi:hypothetical protein